MLRRLLAAFGAIALVLTLATPFVLAPREVRASGTPTPWTFVETVTFSSSDANTQTKIQQYLESYIGNLVTSPQISVAAPTVTVSPTASPGVDLNTLTFTFTFPAGDLQTAQTTINNITHQLAHIVTNPQLTIVVPPSQYAAIAASPNSITFNSTPAQGVALSEYLYGGSFTATAAPSAPCASNAVVDSPSPSASPAYSNSQQQQTWNVTPVATGSCNLAWNDSNGQQTVIAISVVYGPLVVSNAAVALPSPTAAATTDVSEAFYTGTLTASPAAGCAGVMATPSPLVTHGPSDVQNFTGVAAGSCTVTVTDANGHTVTYTVTVP